MRKNLDAPDVIGEMHSDLRTGLLLVHTSTETQERRIHRRRSLVHVVDELAQILRSVLFGYQRIAAAKANERAVGLVVLSTTLHDWVWKEKGRRGSLEFGEF